ncbi:DinB family protein [Geodermatophilus sp. FMUSA9-8]|uniref:DinB family protein n=1 Tax=Geodermatophilus sp. FMUSA9-8 TaxID=3120155 RepID=UPI00300B70E7
MSAPDERDLLLRMLENQRTGLRNALLGLTEEQARARPSASELSLSALVKHVTQGERVNVAGRIGGRPHAVETDPQAGWMAGFTVAADETVEVLLRRWAEVARETEEVVRAEPDLDRVVPLADDVARWMPAGTVFTVRWMLLHQIEEQARHAGHADVIRESIDGKGAWQLEAEAQGIAAPGWR